MNSNSDPDRKNAFDLPIRHRLPTKLGSHAILAGLMIGIVLSIFQVVSDFRRERNTIELSIQQLTSTLKEAASEAAYHEDEARARSVISGLFAFPGVYRAEIIDDFGRTLAQETRGKQPLEPNMIARLLVGEVTHREIVLAVADMPHPVGRMRIWLDLNRLAENFGSRVWLVVASGIFRNLLLATLLALIFYWVIAKPLVEAVDQIRSGVVREGRGDIVVVPSSHANDELGMLLRSVNTFVAERGKAEEKLRNAHDELEQHVQERTRELTTEITERKRAEESLRQSESQLRLITDNLPVLIAYVDAEERYHFANKTYREWTRRSVEYVYGTGVKELLGEQTYQLIKPRIDAALSGETVRFEEEVLYPDGKRRHIDAMYVPDVGDDGRARGFFVLISDITERKAAEEQARKNQMELAHVLRVSTMGEMATALAHEVNQPLAAIANFCHGSARRIKSGKWNAAELVKVLGEAGAEAERAGQIVHGIRSFVRKSEPKTDPEDINSIVRAAMSLAEAEARENKVKVRLDLADGLPPVVVDATEIEQVVLNLLRNGIDAMMECHGRDRKLTIRTLMGSDDSVEVGVRDKGPGLPAELGSAVFEPFISAKPGGMGLGLSISRTIMEAHGGTISASDNADGGATFRLTLPAAT